MTEPAPTYTIPGEPVPDPAPSPIRRLLELIAKLPPDLQADWDGSNHYELTTPDERFPWWWLNLNDYMVADFDSGDEVGQRVGLLLDLAEAAKAAEAELLWRFAEPS